MDIYNSPNELLESKKNEISNEINAFIDKVYPPGQPMYITDAKVIITIETMKILSKHVPVRFIPDVMVDIDQNGKIKVIWGECPDTKLDESVLN